MRERKGGEQGEDTEGERRMKNRKGARGGGGGGGGGRKENFSEELLFQAADDISPLQVR